MVLRKYAAAAVLENAYTKNYTYDIQYPAQYVIYIHIA